MTAITRRTVLAGAAAVALARPAIAQGPMRWRFAHPHPESDSWHKAALRFAELVKERTKGAIEIQVFPNGVLGNDPTTINAVRGGSLDIALTGNPFFTGLAPKLNVLDLPFLFRDRKHAAAVLDGPIGEGLRKELEGSNLKALATWDIGWRNLTNNRRPVRTPDDLKGLKIRTTPNPAHIKAFQLLGAVPTPMAFTELFTALEMGSVDGQENPVTLILNAKFFEVQKHLTLTRHAFTTGPLVMNKAKFDALSPELQKILVETRQGSGAAAVEDERGQRSVSSLAELKAKGMQVVETVDREAFRKIVADEVRKDFVQKFGPSCRSDRRRGRLSVNRTARAGSKPSVDKGFHALEALLGAHASPLMVVMVFANVVLRYGFGSGITVSEEISRFLFVWLIFLGSVPVMRQHGHLGVEMLVGKLSAAGRRIGRVVSDVFVLGCCVVFGWGAWEQTQLNMANLAPGFRPAAPAGPMRRRRLCRRHRRADPRRSRPHGRARRGRRRSRRPRIRAVTVRPVHRRAARRHGARHADRLRAAGDRGRPDVAAQRLRLAAHRAADGRAAPTASRYSRCRSSCSPARR